MKARTIRAWPVVMLLAWGGPAAGQTLPGYWAALERVSSVSELPPPPEAESAVAQGLYLLRRYELGRDRTDALVGQSALERLVAREPGNAWAHFALGALLARGPDVRTTLGDDPDAYVAWRYSLAAQHAPRALRRALELDPGLHAAALVLGRLALDLGDPGMLGEALELLGREGRDTLAEALGLRAELLLVLEESVRSAAVADSARLRGLDGSVAAHLRAAALLRTVGGDEQGARVYFEGVEQLTPTGARTYYDAVSVLVSARERAEWLTADLAGKRAWLRRFWVVQAGLAGVPVAERLAEHFGRLLHVRRDGRVARMGAEAALGSFDPRSLGVPSMDLLTLLRHGDPDRVEKVMFCGRDVLDLPLPHQPTLEECRRSPLGRHRARGLNRLTFFQAQDAAAAGTSYYPAFDQHLALTWDILQFRGEGGTTRVVAPVAVPVSDAAALVQASELVARTELFLVDTTAGTVQYQESLARFAVGPLPPRGWMLLRAELDAPRPGERAYRVSVTNQRRRAGAIVGGTVSIRDYTADTLSLSDAVLAPLDATGSFQRGAQTIALAPGREYRRTESVALYYELYGLREGEAYRTEIEITPQLEGVFARMRSLFPGAPEALRLSFAEEAGAVHPVFGVQQLRTVGLSGLLPGAYRLRVTVTAARGRRAHQDQVLYVVDGEVE